MSIRDGNDASRDDEPSAVSSWQVLESRKLLSRTFVTVWEDRVELASGHTMDDFLRIDSPDWAGVLCLNRAGRVVLVRQYRHGVGRESLELPAGALERGEQPLDGARRELLEETGYVSSDWRPIAALAVDPSRQQSRGHFYCALDAERQSAPRLDPGEDLHALEVTPDELLRLIDEGRLFHGLHVAAVLTAHRRGLLRASAGATPGGHESPG